MHPRRSFASFWALPQVNFREGGRCWRGLFVQAQGELACTILGWVSLG
jgi:hypothetical protein